MAKSPLPSAATTGLVVAEAGKAVFVVNRHALVSVRPTNQAPVESSACVVRFRVTVSEGGLCKFSYSGTGDDWNDVADNFQAQPGVWIGAKLGVYCISANKGAGGGFADFDYFRFTAK